jgi:hypothetical protein
LQLGAFALLDGLPQEIFDLTIDAAEFILRPGFELGPMRRIDAQKKGFPFHPRDLSVVKRAGIYDRVHLGFTAEDHHTIADQGSAASTERSPGRITSEYAVTRSEP